jgi:hypothetical protein
LNSHFHSKPVPCKKYYLPDLLPVPADVVTLMLPDDPPATIAVIFVEDTIANEAAAVAPKLTAVAPVKLVPLIVTVIPLAAEEVARVRADVKEVTVGTCDKPFIAIAIKKITSEENFIGFVYCFPVINRRAVILHNG